MIDDNEIDDNHNNYIAETNVNDMICNDNQSMVDCNYDYDYFYYNHGSICKCVCKCRCNNEIK